MGAGVAAATAADSLRSGGFDGRLVIVGRESDPPYNRPTLSKERLRGEVSDEQTLFHPADYYGSKEIELLLEHDVTRVAVAEHAVEFANGERLAYDRVLIVTGAHLRYLSTPGVDLAGIYYLRSLRDSRDLSDALARRPRLLVAGTGFIGCEVAASARTIGCEVTLVGNKAPLEGALGAQIGDCYAQFHRDRGVDVRTGTFVLRFEGAGKLERAVLFDGTSVECDAAAIGIGVEPTVDLVRGEPVETNDGILVDEFCKTSAPNVFAAGDVAQSWNPRYAARVRVEHFNNAQQQAVAAAKSMLGSNEAYNPIPSFWSDQFSYQLQYRGYAPEWDALIFRGKPQEGSFSAFYLKGGAVAAICSVNRNKENYASRLLVGKTVEPQLLANDEIDVKQIGV